ncbi:hypothetical protein [Primorskyibacter flagellatus]|uniref:Uncharacterized protein n=1 Tax=Primorskyibacter flagellatus TaxID=1387277 RepID=A0A1W2C3Y0_9RHOB|nr:hypothetical protein SAMN06295998_1067 [Primorskyibacter flagellatus]
MSAAFSEFTPAFKQLQNLVPRKPGGDRIPLLRLAQLLKAELADREVRPIAYNMKGTRFPAAKGLSGFVAASDINEATRAPTSSRRVHGWCLRLLS